MNVAVAKQSNYYTIQDIYNLPDGQRAELIDGVLYMMATPSVLSRLYLAKLRRINFHQQGGEGRRCGGIVDRRQRSLMEI